MPNLSEIQKQNGWSEEEAIQFGVSALNMAYEDARFVLAQEKGEVKSDVVNLDEEPDPMAGA